MYLSFVLLAEPQPLVDAGEVIAAYRELAPGGPELRRGRKTDKEGLMLFEADGAAVMLALLYATVPKREADDAAELSVCRLKGWTLAPHRAQIIVTMPKAPKGMTYVQGLTLFTRLVAAVAQANGAMAIYDGHAHATHDASFFIHAAKLDGPIMLWTGVSIANPGDGRLSLLSVGMERFGLMDLLFSGKRGGKVDALSMFFDLLSYVVDSGAVPNAGETIGPSADVKWKVKHVPSPIDASTIVWSVDAK